VTVLAPKVTHRKWYMGDICGILHRV